MIMNNLKYSYTIYDIRKYNIMVETRLVEVK